MQTDILLVSRSEILKIAMQIFIPRKQAAVK
jgi:hypothetical protein